MAQLGVELGSRAVRAVRIDTWPKARTRAVEIEWNRNAPDDLVEALRPLGAARRIAVAVDLPLLYTKRVKLPTLPAAERRKILQLEPERFFAVRARDLVCAVSATDDLVFATPETALAGWVAALEQLAPVDLVEPMPAALARALARARLRDAHILLDARDEGVGLVEIRGGRVAHARRLFGDLAAVARALAADAAPTTIYLSPWDDSRGRALQSLLPAVAVRPFPAVGEVTDAFLPAFGAALAIGARREYAETLVPPALATRITTRRWRVRGAGLAALILTFGFAVTSLDAWRARATRELETGLQALRRRAAPALVAQTRLEALGREAQAIHATERQRPDPLGVLLALSTHLPAGAYLRGLRWSGGEWQIDGYAPNAARLVAELGATATFTDVRFLSATTRVALGKRTYENFALAFRYARAP